MALEIFQVEHLPWYYGVELCQEENNKEVAFQPLPLTDIMASMKVVQDEPGQESSKEETSQETCPTLGPCSSTQAADFSFENEVEHLPCRLNLGDVPLDKEHKVKFIYMIYSNQEVFSLHDEDLGYCDQLTHTILTSINKPIYLPQRTVPRQLHGKVHKCLDTWLHEGIIHQSNSHPTVPMHLKVVIVHKNTGEICLCVNYRKLNSITIRSAFPSPCIDKALQAVHSSNVFTSFDLVQGYLQLAMAEDDIKKTSFRASSSGLCEFTCMPFGLSNAGSSFCKLLEQCLGDQQFVTLLLCLDDICVFTSDVSTMLNQLS